MTTLSDVLATATAFYDSCVDRMVRDLREEFTAAGIADDVIDREFERHLREIVEYRSVWLARLECALRRATGERLQ